VAIARNPITKTTITAKLLRIFLLNQSTAGNKALAII